jgi:hypothetical protein
MKGDAMKSIDIKRIPTLSFVVVAVISLVGCSSAKPTDDPGVDRMGKYILMNKGPEVEVVVGYRHAQNSLGSEWLLLEIAMTSPVGQTATIKRENVSVSTPAGVKIPLATQTEFNQDYGTLQSFLHAADVVRDPMDYWQPRTKTCAIRFFVTPTEGISFDEVSFNFLRACQGRFLFKIPGGVQAGRYVLTIDLEESEIRIPITFED